MENDKTKGPQPAEGSSLPAPTTLSTGESSRNVSFPNQSKGSEGKHIVVTDLPFSGPGKGQTFFNDEERLRDNPTTLKPSSGGPLKVVSDPTQDSVANEPSMTHLRVDKLAPADTPSEDNIVPEIDEVLGASPAPERNLEPHLTGDGRCQSSQQTRMNKTFPPIEAGQTLEDWMKGRPGSRSSIHPQENKHPSTLHDSSKTVVSPSEDSPRDVHSAGRSFQVNTVDLTPIDINQKETSVRDPSTAATTLQGYPIDLDKLNLEATRPSGDERSGDSPSGFGNAPTAMENSSPAQDPTPTSPPETVSPSPAHGHRLSELFARECIIDLDEVMEGNE